MARDAGFSNYTPKRYTDLHKGNLSLGKRVIKYHAGPTNSGKTHGALQLLAEYGGAYLAPLRLLALEVFESILERPGIRAKLVTGEERRGDDNPYVTSSTIEMMDRRNHYRVVVIDEFQMAFDSSRGAAWVDAFFGSNCDMLILCGSHEGAEGAKTLAAISGENIEIINFERKSPLVIQEVVTRNDDLEANTALIAFSKKAVLRIRDSLMRAGRSVAIIYGSLGPEVRREEARRFREGEAEILVATDAIGMGLNLPIKKIVFTTHMKFDGNTQRLLSRDEVLQIAGRAGRFGMFEEGLVSALNKTTLAYISEIYNSKPEVTRPMRVFMTLEQIKDYMTSKSCSFSNAVRSLRRVNTTLIPGAEPIKDDIVCLAEIIDDVPGLSDDDKFRLMFAPVERGGRTQYAFLSYCNAIGGKKTVKSPMFDWAASDDMHKLRYFEENYQIVSLYRWIANRYPAVFTELSAADMQIQVGNLAITEMLKMKLAKTCESCNLLLSPSWPHRLCDECHYSHRG